MRTGERRAMRSRLGAAVGLLAGGLALLATSTGIVGSTARRVSADSATTVNFDSPAPPTPPGPLGGVFAGIDFGTGQWALEGPFDVDPTNNIYFSDSTGTSRTFAFSPGPQILGSLRVFTVTPGTLTLSDDAGQTWT